MLFGLESVVLSVTTDAAKGVTERIRSMPISAVAVLGGRAVADLCSAVFGLAILIGAGLLTGWAPQRGLLPALAAVGLLLWLRCALAWVGIYLGLLLKTPESAVAVQVLIWPVGFLSSIFVAPSTMPRWLEVTAAWNPLSATATAIRDLFGNPTWGASDWASEHALLLAVAWPVVLTAVAVPLAARQWRALSG
jgi:ABC-2 type transport system permease protein